MSETASGILVGLLIAAVLGIVFAFGVAARGSTIHQDCRQFGLFSYRGDVYVCTPRGLP